MTGCTDEALRLIGSSRKYFAHLGRERGGPAVEEIESNMLQSTRRASALMQACLLREIGFDTEKTEALLRKHYSNWPLH